MRADFQIKKGEHSDRGNLTVQIGTGNFTHPQKRETRPRSSRSSQCKRRLEGNAALRIVGKDHLPGGAGGRADEIAAKELGRGEESGRSGREESPEIGSANQIEPAVPRSRRKQRGSGKCAEDSHSICLRSSINMYLSPFKALTAANANAAMKWKTCEEHEGKQGRGAVGPLPPHQGDVRPQKPMAMPEVLSRKVVATNYRNILIIGDCPESNNKSSPVGPHH